MRTLPIKLTLTTAGSRCCVRPLRLAGWPVGRSPQEHRRKCIKASMLRLFTLIGCLLASGCAILPEIVHQPTLHNPFPQISKVAVATFFNASSEPTLDGHKVAEAYAAELGEVPGYVVIPVSQVETVMHAYGLRLEKEKDARRLAQLLEVDAVVVGVVTEYTPYYPPRMTLQVCLVHGQSELPSHPGRLWPAVGNGGRERHSWSAGFPIRVGAGERTTQDANSALSETPPSPPASAGPGGASCADSPPVVPGQPLRGAVADSKQEVRTVSHEAADSSTPANLPALPRRPPPANRKVWGKCSGSSAKLARPARIHSPAARRLPAARRAQRRAGDATHEELSRQ